MKDKILYQTLDDNDNADYVEQNAPFPCDRKNSWLGTGYYFWDTFIENAHWWGEVNYKNSYIICKAVCDFDTDIEPLLVRYGIQAMIRQNAQDIKIAIDLKFIVESRYEV